MKADIIKKNTVKIFSYLAFKFPPTSWYFSKTLPEDSVVFKKDKWICMFMHLKRVAKGNRICFAKDRTGCKGPDFYFGFKEVKKGAGKFLSSHERFKKTEEMGDAFYQEIKAIPAKQKYILWERIEDLKDNIEVEVVNLWVNTDDLTKLVTLVNYDREDNNNVMIPFASGCQGIFTIPFKEKFKDKPKAVAGLWIRPYENFYLRMQSLFLFRQTGL